MMIEKSKRRQGILILGILFAAVILLFMPGRADALTPEDAAVAVSKGWHTLPSGGYTYMISNSTHATGFLRIKNKWYHFDDEGYLSLRWFVVNGKKYFAYPGSKVGRKKGVLRSGYAKAEGVYYYFSEKNKAGKYGALETGWITYKGKHFYYTPEGTKLTGLQELNGNIYYFDPQGTKKNAGCLKTGWVTISGKKYYFRSKGKVGKKYGAAYRDKTVKINGKKYTFDSTGALATESSGTEQQKKFIEMIGPMAHNDMLATGILASVTIAQACIESGYGTSSLAVNANNLFGMKASIGATTWTSVWDGVSVYTVNTQEYVNGAYKTISADFRKYPSIADSLADHSAYLAGAKLSDTKLRYEGIVGCRDYKQAATIIKNGGYATAPNYVEVIVNTIETFGLTKYD